MSPYWLNADARTFLSRDYLVEGQTPEQRIRVIAENAERILKLPGFADKLEQYVLNGWVSLASPVWSNFGTNRGLPISCNGSYLEDTTESIIMKSAEIGMMTKFGAGTSAYIGQLRPRGAKISHGGVSSGPVHFMEIMQAFTTVISQSSVRRGNCAVYLPVDHPDIMEFLEGREEGNTIQHLMLGVCISDEWMQSMVDGDRDKRNIWTRIVKKRFETGVPYIFWTDAVNRDAPDVYQDLERKISASNLCTEIMLSSTEDESFVCCLSSMNLLHYDAWKDTDCVETMVYFLDAVLTEYLEKIRALPQSAFRLMEAAYNFALRQRAIGLGTLGWHSLLQSLMIPFESMEAKLLNTTIHRHIAQKASAASEQMATEYGTPPMLEGYGRRHVTLMAVAPTTSSSFILGQVSPSIEPYDSNYFQADIQKGVFTFRNPYLQKTLAEHGKDTPEVWRDILTHGGSVQQLTFLTDHERSVFKTFGELSQWEIIIQASARQKFIDQGQSLNLKVHPNTPAKDVSNLMIEAWRLGIKSLYYQKSTNRAQEYARSLVECVSCEA